MIPLWFRIWILILSITVHGAAQNPFGRNSSITPSDSVPSDTILSDTMVKGNCSFKADHVDLQRALTLFAGANGLDMVSDSLQGDTLSVEFNQVSFSEAMKRILGTRPLAWSINEGALFISAVPDSSFFAPIPLKVISLTGSRIFKINYPRLKRSGHGSSSASISSAASGQAGSVQLSTVDEILFWQELEEQLKLLISPNGKLIISKMSGIIQVIDSKDHLDIVQSYLSETVPVAMRQVEITARIYEVSLDKEHSLGIDWTLVSQKIEKFGGSGALGGAANLIVRSPEFKAATTSLDLSVDGKLSVLLNALKEQGTVHAVSQPRIMTMNNQPALVKIGTDFPFFSASIIVNPTTNQREIQEEVRIITVGVVLSVTPQISEDGWITLGIDPLISDLVSTATSINGSTAPVIDVKQSSALVRLRDRTTVRISGLLQTKKSLVERKIPILGDIPLLGRIFRWSYSKETRKELVIFITPRRI